ncbi:MAG: DUF58 domain-containing protein [Clostridia bacterium]|nr:DUF58 domain-containing protein [Oscillospiraceae bacterium]MBO5258022.1 DUF58 domain-containing protein [Clostridia bacterium]MBP3294636.1 DUF58 domain-containing protein [Clostridia bacterium]
MDNNYNKKPLVKFTKSAIVYACLLVFALVFTQALRAKASAVLFWFLVLMPIVSIIYVLVGKALIRIYVGSDITKVEKLQPVEYELRIINASPFAYPFIEAIISVPQPDGVRCTEQSLTMSLAPMGSYIVNHTTSFKYRGTYEIGVRCLYISDFLGLFAIRLDVDIYNNVLVFPRKLNMNMKMATSATDIPNDSAKLVFSTEKAEIGNIREYIPGDSLKSVHWNLSSKSPVGTLMVKDFNTNTSQSVYVLCDFSRAIPPEVFEDEEARIEREKAEREAKRKPKTKNVKLKQAKPDKETLAAEKAARKQAGRIRSGMTGTGASDAAAIDAMIDAADAKSPKKPPKDSAKRQKPLFGKKKNAAVTEEQKSAEVLAEEAIAAEKKRRDDETKAQLAVGGIIKPEFAPDMDEFCADGVVEMAMAATLNELRNGNTVTLIWNDARSDTGIVAVELSCPEDFDSIYSVFATAPSAPEKTSISDLLLLIQESLNVTIRICTSNIDPLSLNQYGAIPGLFGGAGTGCVAELLVFNPEDRYEDIKIRREYVEMCRLRLAQDGVDLTELKAVKDETGNYTIRKIMN